MMSIFPKNSLFARSLALLKLLLVLWLWASTTLFVHPHTVDGQIIYHSHPYSSAAHAHSTAEIVAIVLLSVLSALAAVGFSCTNIFLTGVHLVRRSAKQFIQKFSGVARSLRAPPVAVTTFF